jgi:hypothetical protein
VYDLLVNVDRARCAGSALDIAILAILSGVTLRDRNDKRVFIQNFKRWCLMSGSAQTRIVLMSLQLMPHLFRTVPWWSLKRLRLVNIVHAAEKGRRASGRGLVGWNETLIKADVTVTRAGHVPRDGMSLKNRESVTSAVRRD